MHLLGEADAARALGIPPGVLQAALVPIADPTVDDFGPSKRLPPSEVAYLNRWSQPIA
jgi:hypothetical protein